MLIINKLDNALIPTIIASLIGTTYALGFIRCQAPYANEFGLISYPYEYYLYNGFQWVVALIMRISATSGH